jgi:TonB family protein
MKTKCQLLFVLLLLFSSAYAVNLENIVNQQFIDNGNYVESYEIIPRFPGGDKALSDFIKRNMRYPKSAKKKGIEGRVVVRFFVETDGKLTNFSIAKSVNSQLDKEALRIVKKMPKWEPGQLGGRIVRMSCAVPVLFRCKSSHAPLVLRPDSTNRKGW